VSTPADLLGALLPGELRREHARLRELASEVEVEVIDAHGTPPALSARARVFHLDEDPLPGASWPRPRRTGWERE
jgi:hypothetical protein